MDDTAAAVAHPEPGPGAPPRTADRAAAIDELVAATSRYWIGLFETWSELSLRSHKLALDVARSAPLPLQALALGDRAAGHGPTALYERCLDATFGEAARLQARVMTDAAEQWRQLDGRLRQDAQQFAGALYDGRRKLLGERL